MELLNVAHVAAKLHISVRSVWRLRDAGRMPGAVLPGGARCIRWRAADIDAWIAAGLPDCHKTGWTAPVVGCGGECRKGGCGHG